MDEAMSGGATEERESDPVHGVLDGIFSTRGYLSRQYFLVRWVLFVVPALVIAGIALADRYRPAGQPKLLPGWLVAMALAGLAWAWACMQVQRLRDANLSPLWAIAGFIPYLGLLAVPLLGCMPTRYGSETASTRPDGRQIGEVPVGTQAQPHRSDLAVWLRDGRPVTPKALVFLGAIFAGAILGATSSDRGDSALGSCVGGVLGGVAAVVALWLFRPGRDGDQRP